MLSLKMLFVEPVYMKPMNMKPMNMKPVNMIPMIVVLYSSVMVPILLVQPVIQKHMLKQMRLLSMNQKMRLMLNLSQWSWCLFCSLLVVVPVSRLIPVVVPLSLPPSRSALSSTPGVCITRSAIFPDFSRRSALTMPLSVKHLNGKEGEFLSKSSYREQIIRFYHIEDQEPPMVKFLLVVAQPLFIMKLNSKLKN